MARSRRAPPPPASQHVRCDAMRCQPPRAAAASQPAAVTFKATSQRRQVAAQAGHSTRRTRYSCPARSGSLPTAELDQRMSDPVEDDAVRNCPHSAAPSSSSIRNSSTTCSRHQPQLSHRTALKDIPPVFHTKHARQFSRNFYLHL
jgi:hypothetical protein